jgi:predicted AlkP superfamily pyrophosphatase or phosphodiesterase
MSRIYVYVLCQKCGEIWCVFEGVTLLSFTHEAFLYEAFYIFDQNQKKVSHKQDSITITIGHKSSDKESVRCAPDLLLLLLASVNSQEARFLDHNALSS